MHQLRGLAGAVVISLTTAIWSLASSQRPRAGSEAAIVVRASGIVSADVPTINHAEPWLAVDPRNAEHAIVVALADSGGESAAFATFDGGVTWRRGSHDGAEPTHFSGGDPVVAFDDDGTALLATVSPFLVWRSHDGGVRWGAPSIVPGRSYDREYLAIRPASGAADTVYALAKTPIQLFGHQANDVLALARSTDGGASFDPPRLLLPDPTTSILHTAGGLVVAPDGTLFISFVAHDAPLSDVASIRNHVWVMRSIDGGRTFGEPVSAAASVVYGNGGDEMRMLKSLAVARLVVDTAHSSPYRGRLHVSYLTVLDGRTQVMVVTSADSGRTWGPAVRVNDDRGTSNHSNPQISVNDRGIVAVSWNDRRADPDDLCFRATLSASIDGGATFLPNVELEATSTCPLGVGVHGPLVRGAFTSRFMQGGETQGLAALPGGRFLAVFVGGRSAMQLHSSTIEITGNRGHR